MSAVVIKKYGNRRLYDTSTSRYVNFDDIAARVRNGDEVRIEDAKSGEDLTRATLTQIIVEDAKGKPSGLPLEVLRQIIQASDQAGREFLGWYLKSAFEGFEKLQSGLSEAARSPLAMVRGVLGGNRDDELQELRARVAELEAQAKKPKKKSVKKESKRHS